MVKCLVIKLILTKLKKANSTLCNTNLWSYFCQIKTSRIQAWYWYTLVSAYLLLEKHTEIKYSYPKLLTHKPLQLDSYAGSTFTPKLPLQAAPCDRSPSCLQKPHPFRHIQLLFKKPQITQIQVCHIFPLNVTVPLQDSRGPHKQHNCKRSLCIFAFTDEFFTIKEWHGRL